VTIKNFKPSTKSKFRSSINYTLDKQPTKISFEFLKSHLWSAADILRGSLDPSEYRQPVMTLLFLKRLNDTFEENAENLVKKGRSRKEAYENRHRHYFFIPEKARWSVLSSTAENIGEKIDDVCRIIERENKDLEGVLTNTKYNDKRKYPDDKLRALISHFNSPRLRNEDLEKEDVFGDAYEYLLEEFADQTKKRGGEFFTPREVVRLLVNITEPKEGMKICDPTCGSGGMLIESRKYVERNGGNPRNLVLEGQESNYGNLAMCKMNMVLHNIVDFKIEYGDLLTNPRLVEGGRLKKYDKVLANFPFSMDWDNKQATKDPYHRYKFGIPPSQDKADFAFIQHMYSSLNDTGQVAVICSQGVLFRGNEESRIRENMIKEDIIEGVIALPPKVFFGTGIPACVLILNKDKPKERKNKVIFIHAAKDYQEGKVRNLLREQDIEKITKAFKKYKDVEKYCHIADLEELKENEFNLNVPRYVDISYNDEEIDIQKTIDDLSKLEQERLDLATLIKHDLKELGFIV
jgi:type I restriction enzyme M protein